MEFNYWKDGATILRHFKMTLAIVTIRILKLSHIMALSMVTLSTMVLRKCHATPDIIPFGIFI